MLRDVHVDMPKPTLKSSAFEVFGFDVRRGSLGVGRTDLVRGLRAYGGRDFGELIW